MTEVLTVNVSGSGSDLVRIEMTKADLAVLRDMACYACIRHRQDMEAYHFAAWNRLWCQLEDINIGDYLISEGAITK